MNTGRGKKSRWQDVAQRREVTLDIFVKLRIPGGLVLRCRKHLRMDIVSAVLMGLVGYGSAPSAEALG